MASLPEFGALIISLDFALQWGVRASRNLSSPYVANILGARNAIPRILKIFQTYGISATWATVGLLFCSTREEIEQYFPKMLPHYQSPHLFAHREITGLNEDDDPFHYAPTLIRLI